jgi:hypothetical protein
MRTDKRNLTTTVPMTGKGQKTLTVKKRQVKFQQLGDSWTKEGINVTTQSQEQLGLVNWCVSHACAAANKSLWLTMKIMTVLWMSCGFANRATNSGTKSF